MNRDGLFVINRMVDLSFLCDLFISFRLAYFDNVKGELVTDPEAIRWHYIKG